METKELSGWIPVFEQLERDKERFLRYEMTIGGKKKVFTKDEVVFFLGDVRCSLTMDGWKFFIK